MIKIFWRISSKKKIWRSKLVRKFFFILLEYVGKQEVKTCRDIKDLFLLPLLLLFLPLVITHKRRKAWWSKEKRGKRNSKQEAK